jgi:hypothetical protein
MNSTAGGRGSSGLKWSKSSYSSDEGGNCVEVAVAPAAPLGAGTPPDCGPDWFKSSHSGSEGGNCVEVALPTGAVLVRDSKCPAGPVLSATPGAWDASLRFADGTT